MNLNFGINTGIEIETAGSIVVNSQTPIGIVVPFKNMQEFKVFNTATDMKDFLTNNGATNEDLAYKTANAIDLQNVTTKIVVVLVAEGDTVKQNILDGLDTLKSAPYTEDILTTPNLIIVPKHSFDVDIAVKMDSIAAKFRATAIVDVNATNEAEATAFANNFGSRFVLLYNGESKVEGKLYPTSALIAGLIAYWDAGGDNGFDEFGYTRSHSNRIVKGVTGGQRTIEYFDAEDCEALRLRQKGVGSIVFDLGWRSYGFETTDINPIWQSLDRVRIFYRWLDAIKIANKWAMDRNASQLVWVKKTCSDFFRKLTGAGIALGFSIELDENRSDVTIGKFTFVLKTENMPSIRELNFILTFTDDFNDPTIEWLKTI